MTQLDERPGLAAQAAHPVDQVPAAPKLIVLALQHLFIMYAGAVAVPFIVGNALGLSQKDIAILVNMDLLVSGICTILQAAGLYKLKWAGSRLPIIAGATFTVLSPMLTIAFANGGAYAGGLATVYGSLLVAGVFGLLIARPFSMMIRFFPPLVSGTVIAIIGLSLIGVDITLITGDATVTQVLDHYPSAAELAGGSVKAGSATGTWDIVTANPDYAKPSFIGLAMLVILVIILISRFAPGFAGQLAVLVAVVVGVVVAWPMGLLDFHEVGSASWFGIAAPFHFGAPQFHFSAIVSMCIVVLVTYTESTADTVAVAEMTDSDLPPKRLAAGLAVDGFSFVLAGFMNSFPDTAYAENVGLLGITKVRSRWVVALCGVFLVILGVIPKMGAIIAALPDQVIGGAATVMFAMVTVVGIQTLSKVSFRDNHNLLIVAVSLSVGMAPALFTSFYSKFPEWFQTIFGSAITSTVIVVFVLNLLFNHFGHRGEPEALETAVHEGAYAPGIPNDGVNVSDGYPENWQKEPGVVARGADADAR
ncbi:nucleobase:cation symporter-2, NCS2 family [Nakamurella panacisegetis]|uniref:Nucleobase:cation symporter-2, NCS2 family n=1 Tax=Nakamurella panacisegetis TaxID=1090615 RepID=A0A1H0RZ39_9ACTN|nr:nucleobase:cation symporter-2 family protein [Nakamurella panacisegetis]SDP34841.1 nucleobase:cation symporter-2, NCS2 family [Nakamurella panacisegetis]